MRLLVYGGRDFTNRERLFASLFRLARDAELHGERLIIIQGESGTLDRDTGKVVCGADLLAKEFALENEYDHVDFPADWKNFDLPGAVRKQARAGYWYNATAGFHRNQQMIDQGRPDAALECPGDKGTADMRKRLNKAGLSIMKI